MDHAPRYPGSSLPAFRFPEPDARFVTVPGLVEPREEIHHW